MLVADLIASSGTGCLWQALQTCVGGSMQSAPAGQTNDLGNKSGIVCRGRCTDEVAESCHYQCNDVLVAMVLLIRQYLQVQSLPLALRVGRYRARRLPRACVTMRC